MTLREREREKSCLCFAKFVQILAPDLLTLAHILMLGIPTALRPPCRRMLELGQSRPWPEALRVLTGEEDLSAAPLLSYYQPLREWLERETRENEIPVGWW